jgi:hypothetical protein
MDNKRPIWHYWRLIAIALLALVSLPGQGSAAPSSGPAQLVKAIRISTDDSSPTGLTAVGNRVSVVHIFLYGSESPLTNIQIDVPGNTRLSLYTLHG